MSILDPGSRLQKPEQKRPVSANEVECGLLELVSTDSRRCIYEHNASGSSMQEFVVNDDVKPLGQHFHKKKSEAFYFLEGGGTIKIAQVNEDGVIVGEVREFRVGQRSYILIPPFHTHRFDLSKNSRFIVFSSEPFDVTDNHPCPIE